MQYEQILLETEGSHAEQIELWLIEQELSFEQMDETTINPPPKGKVRFRLVVKPEEAAPLVMQIKEELTEMIPSPLLIEYQKRDDSEWQDTWKAFFATRQVGQFAIVPSWEEKDYHSVPSEIPLFLDPGRAFGTGGHASTRLCLSLLSQLQLPALEILDVGCGSGILTIASLKKYPRATAIGIDIDQDSVEVTEENAERNEVSNRMTVSTTPIAKITKNFDLVFANLTGPVILELAPHLARVLSQQGVLLVSGIVQSETPEVKTALEQQGLLVSQSQSEDEWVGLVLKKKQ